MWCWSGLEEVTFPLPPLDHMLDVMLVWSGGSDLPFTSTWPHVRCDVGLVWRKGNINKTVAVLPYCIMVHTCASRSYRLVDCIGLWSCLVYLSFFWVLHFCIFGLHCAVYVSKKFCYILYFTVSMHYINRLFTYLLTYLLTYDELNLVD